MASFMQNISARWVFYGVALAIVGMAMAQALYLAAGMTPADDVLTSDFANYTIAILQAEDETLFSSDPVWSSGELTATITASSSLYMFVSHVLYDVNGDHFGWTRLTLRMLSFAMLSYGLYLLFLSIVPRPVFALALAFTVVSTISAFLLYLPTAFSWAFMSMAMIGVYHWLVIPGLEQRKPDYVRLFILGFIIGASPLVFGSVNGLSFITWLGVVTGIQLLVGRLRLPAFGALWLGVAPIFAFIVLFGTGGTGGQISDESAQWLITTIAFAPYDVILNFGVACLLVALTGLMASFKPNRLTRSIFIFANTAVWLHYGFRGQYDELAVLGILLALLIVYRIIQKQDTRTEYAFVVAITVASFNGMILQKILHLLWDMTGWHTLINIMWQMFRFSDLVFLPFFMALFYVLGHIIRGIPHALYGFMAFASLCFSLFKSVDQYRFTSPDLYPLMWVVMGMSCVVMILMGHPLSQKYFNFSRLSAPDGWLPAVALVFSLLAVAPFAPDWMTIWFAILFMVALVWLLAGNRLSYAFALVVTLGLGAGMYLSFPLESLQGLMSAVFYGVSAGVFLLVPLWMLAQDATDSGKSISGRFSPATAVTASLSIVVGVMIVVAPYVYEQGRNADFDYATSEFYQERFAWLAMLDWIGDNTPQDALVHTATGNQFNENIRSNALRSVLTSWMDPLVAPYAQLEPAALNNLHISSAYYAHVDNMVRFTAEHGVNYLVLDTNSSQTLPDSLYEDVLYRANRVYGNAYYEVYEIIASPAS